MFFQTAFAQTSAAKVTQTAANLGDSTANQAVELVGKIIGQIPLWITAIIVLILSYGVAKLARSLVESKLAEKGLTEGHQEVQIVAGRASSTIVLIIGITVALGIVGIDLQPIVAAGAFGIGFASQDLIMNFMAGMMILASRHYTIGDVIKVAGVTGRIQEIQTRATIIKAFDGTRIVVPNSVLFKNTVISKTSNPYRKLTFIMGVGYEADLRRTMNLTLEVIKSLPEVLKKPKPSVIFYEWGDYSINFRVNVWIDSKGGKLLKVKNAVMIALTEAYNESGINIPYPIQTINFDQAEFTEEEAAQKTKALIKKIKSERLAKEAQAKLLSTPAPMQPQAPQIGTAGWLANALQNQVQKLAPHQPENVPNTQGNNQVANAPAPAPTPVQNNFPATNVWQNSQYFPQPTNFQPQQVSPSQVVNPNPQNFTQPVVSGQFQGYEQPIYTRNLPQQTVSNEQNPQQIETQVNSPIS